LHLDGIQYAEVASATISAVVGSLVFRVDASRVAKRCVIVKDHIAESMLDHATLRFMDWVGNAHLGVALPFNYLSWSRWQKAFDQAGLELHDTRAVFRSMVFPRA
jgi:hypothetical protein